MPNYVARLANCIALAVVVGALSSGTLGAQGSPKVSAWIGSRPITAAGADTGKVILRLKISGIPELAVRSLKATEIVLRAESGHLYMPVGSPVPIPRNASANVAAQFYGVETKSAGQFWFLVSPGNLRYELWLAGYKPVSFGASLVRPPAR